MSSRGKYPGLIEANSYGANVQLIQGVLPEELANRALRDLQEQVKWIPPDENKVFIPAVGFIAVPRSQSAYGDKGTYYRFAGTRVEGKDWSECPVIQEIRKCIQERLGKTFNFVFVNRYANGMQHISWHQDDRRDLQPGSSIVSLSLGQERIFALRRLSDSKRFQGPLKHNTLLVIAPPTNDDFEHCLVKTTEKKAPRERYNLTFRNMHNKS